MAISDFLITNTGLTAANNASPQGPFIKITRFAVASGYGYAPQVTDTGFNGNTLFTGPPTTFQSIGNNTLDVVCVVPPNAGPFLFGEIGIFVEDVNGTEFLFAKAVWDTPQMKHTSLGTNVNQAFTFHCLLKLKQSIAVFEVETVGLPPAVWNVDKWSDVQPPNQFAHPEIEFILVKELGPAPISQSSLLHQASPSRWTVGTGYSVYRESVTVKASSAAYIDLDPDSFTRNSISSQNRRYVLGFHFNGRFRSVTRVEEFPTYFRFFMNPDPTPNPPTNSTVTVYRSAALPPDPDPIAGRTATFTTSGTFIVPEDVYTIYVSGAGGGGGGGGAGGGHPNGQAEFFPAGGGGGGGGGAGQTAQSVVMNVTPGESIVATVGAAGTGGAGGSASGGDGDHGVNGGTTTFGSLTLQGGTAGAAGGGWLGGSTGSGGAGGIEGGSFGGDGRVTGGAGGVGGSSPFGTGGGGGRASTVALPAGQPGAEGIPGGNASGYGAGGGGGGSVYLLTDSGPGGRGGNGSGGYIEVVW